MQAILAHQQLVDETQVRDVLPHHLAQPTDHRLLVVLQAGAQRRFPCRLNLSIMEVTFQVVSGRKRPDLSWAVHQLPPRLNLSILEMFRWEEASGSVDDLTGVELRMDWCTSLVPACSFKESMALYARMNLSSPSMPSRYTRSASMREGSVVFSSMFGSSTVRPSCRASQRGGGRFY